MISTVRLAWITYYDNIYYLKLESINYKAISQSFKVFQKQHIVQHNTKYTAKNSTAVKNIHEYNYLWHIFTQETSKY